MNVFFARLFRTLGRFLMAVGAILCLGFGAIYFIPQSNMTPTKIHNDNPTTSTPETPDSTSLFQDNSINSRIATSFITVVVIVAIIYGIYKAGRYYNNAMRKGIAKLANFCQIQIYHIELLLTLIFWALACAFTFAFSPYIAIVSLLTMIANLLCFTLAWINYGQPSYVI